MPETNPEIPNSPWAAYEKLRAVAPGVFWSPKSMDGDGSWFVTSYELCREVLQQHKRFTTTMDFAPGINNAWPRRLIPLELDPPDHQQYRSLLTPLFAPAAIDRLDAGILATATELIDNVIDDGRCDFMSQFASVLPSTVFIQLLGLDPSERDRCTAWVEAFLRGGTAEERQQVGVDIQELLVGHIEAKRADPGPDLVSELTLATVKGELIDDEYIQDICFLLFLAGLDTVSSGLGHIFRYLGEHEEKRQELRERPELIPEAIEELLRWNSFVNVSRTVRIDTELGGVPVKKGEHIHVILVLADRDDSVFDSPQDVDFERVDNPHLAFSAGVHRCVGSHLARRELRVAIEQWLRRVPDFHVPAGAQIKYSPYAHFTIEQLPLEWSTNP
jgi:cytochrome P450